MGSCEALLAGGPIKGLLLDIHGVLYNSGQGGGAAIPGAVDAVKRLQSAPGLSVGFCSNESQGTRAELVGKLRAFGFDLDEAHVLTPAPAAAALCRKEGLRPFLLVHPTAQPEFNRLSKDDPNCVVVGDAAEAFTYEAMNAAMRVLLESPRLLSLGLGRFYQTTHGLTIDLGPFTKALEYAADTTAQVIGKPESGYFAAGLEMLGVGAGEAVMVGDDIVSDVGGAQKSGLRGVQVRTGKWRAEWENHPSVKPDAIVDSLSHLADQLLSK